MILLTVEKRKIQLNYAHTGRHNKQLRIELRQLPGILKHRMVFAKRSADYLCQLRRTICRRLQTSSSAHSFRANAIDTYHFSLHASPQHWNFPCQPPANHLFQFRTRGYGSEIMVKYSYQKFVKNLQMNSPIGQYPSEKICDPKSCCCNCRPSRKSHDRTVLSRPPVHSFVPSALISIHDAPSV